MNCVVLMIVYLRMHIKLNISLSIILICLASNDVSMIITLIKEKKKYIKIYIWRNYCISLVYVNLNNFYVFWLVEFDLDIECL